MYLVYTKYILVYTVYTKYILDILSIYRQRRLGLVFKFEPQTTKRPHLVLRLAVRVRGMEHSARNWQWRRAIGSARTYTAQDNDNTKICTLCNLTLPARCGLVEKRHS